MKIIFASNFINHHQLPFCEALALLCKEEGGGFLFFEMEEMDEERKGMGWEAFAKPAYIRSFSKENAEELTGLAEEADVLLIGGDGLSEVIEKRLQNHRAVIRISERIYREGQWKRFSPRGLLSKYRAYVRYRNDPYYLLCAGAYVASDFSLIHAFPDKMYRFGYFPETKIYGENRLAEMKADKDAPAELLFAARFLPLKRPDFCIRLAKELKEEGIRFHLSMIGDDSAGDKDFAAEKGLRRKLEEEAEKAGLLENVTFYGMLYPEQVREKMEKADVFLFPSNYLEGWGAVVTEAMNSGCAVVASEEAGVTPYLIRDGENGLSFDGSYEDFAEKVKRLVRDKEQIRSLGQEAYGTIIREWNAGTAASRCMAFCKAVVNGTSFAAPSDGPFSKAPVLKAPK